MLIDGFDLLLALSAGIADNEELLSDIGRAAVELVLLVPVGNGGLDLDVKSPASIVLEGTEVAVRAAIREGEEGNQALCLLVVVLGLAVVALLVVLERVLCGRLTTLDVDGYIFVLVVVDVLEVEDDAVVLEIEGNLSQGLVRGAMRCADTEIPGVAGLVVVLREDKCRRVWNPLVLAILGTSFKRAVLFCAGFDLEMGKRLVGCNPEGPVEGVKEGRSHLLLTEFRNERVTNEVRT
jgi:hypothetical protein